MKKILLLTTFLLVNIAIWAQEAETSGPEIVIGSYEQTATPNFQKFTEPSVRILDGDNIVTNQYTINYFIAGHENETTFRVNSRGAEYTVDDAVNETNKDKTKTTVERLYGDVIMGTSGSVTIRVIATPKKGGEKLRADYTVTIKPEEPTVNFTPALRDIITLNSNVTMTRESWGTWTCLFEAASTVMPTVNITAPNSSGQILDITSKYNITMTLTKADGSPLGNDSKFGLVNNEVRYGANNDHKGDIWEYNIRTEEDGKSKFPQDVLMVTYTFTPTEGNEGLIPVIEPKSVKIRLAPLYTQGDPEELELQFPKEAFKEDDVTYNEKKQAYVIHVYKYGGMYFGESNYKDYKTMYATPRPVLVTKAGGAQLPVLFGAWGHNAATGAWDDFEILYKPMDGIRGVTNPEYTPDEDLGTYYDDCAHLRTDADPTSNVIFAGEPTGLTIHQTHFQTSKPGLVKIAAYPVLKKDNSKADKYKKIGTIKDSYGNEYYYYSEPAYFYIDVMKNIPKLELTPDPSKMVFAKGDLIGMKKRFEVSGYMPPTSNAWETFLVWGDQSNDQDTDHFTYSFFIGTRADYNIEPSEGKPIQLKYWDYNDKDATYEDWQEIPEGDPLVGQPVIIGDKIKTDDTDPDTRLPIYKTVDQEYLDDATSRKTLQAGDMQVGHSFNSRKGWNNENWGLEFMEEGTYDISYTIRPWNHARWDIGTGKAVTYTYVVTDDKLETEIRLNHDYDIMFACDDNFTEPVAKVAVPRYNNMDATDLFDLSYTAKVFEGENPEVGSDWDNGTQISVHQYELSEETDAQGIWSVLTEYKKKADNSGYKKVSEIYRVNKTTGDVKFNDNYLSLLDTEKQKNFEIKVGVSAAIKEEHKALPYNKPEDKEYTLKVVSCIGQATWEIMSTCKGGNPCEDGEYPSIGDEKKTLLVDNGKFHFLTDGALYGGTVIRGVPGIEMTIGTKDTDPELLEDWGVLLSEEKGLKYCCTHEKDNGYHAYVAHKSAPILDTSDDLTPLRGTFYAFRPITNGFLTVDANWSGKVRLVKRDNFSGKATLVEEVDRTSLDKEQRIGEYTFEKPLMNGNTYYVYIEGDKLHLHGFSYKPAFVKDESTTQAETEKKFDASIFLCGISLNLPHIMKYENADVSFDLKKIVEGERVNVDRNYVDVSNIGEITTNHIIEKQLGTQLFVIATIKSPDKALGTCVTKTAEYKLKVIDIPSYRVGATKNNYEPTPRDTVRTTNIPTAITMTFGGWQDNGDGHKYFYGGKEYTDTWTYKSAGGPASRVGSELADDSPVYNKTFDGFDYFNAANNNPVDERNRGVIIKDNGKDSGKDNRYTYASGTEAETATDFTYSTTYRIPCRGAYLKFEPKESGRVLLYIVQNGSIDFHHGLEDVGKSYQIKWRPLYITDETGKPADMVTADGFKNNVSSLLPTGTDLDNIAYYTQGISRCNTKEERIRNAMQGVEGTVIESNCDFDWSQFRGTDDDKKRLLNPQVWPEKGQRERVIRLDNGGFIIPHKSYVRYAFRVKAGKTYFVFQTGSKFEFGGFSFVPEGFPNTCKYQMEWEPKTDDTEDMWTWKAKENTTTQESSLDLDWSEVNNIPAKENVNITLYDGKDAKGATKKRTFSAGKWNSICLPFSVSESQLQSKFGKDYVLVTVDGVNEKGQLQFIRHAHRFIEAGRPYLFKPTADCKGDKSLTFENVTIQAGEKVGGVFSAEDDIIDPTRFDVAVDDYVFKGFYSQQPMPKGSVYAATDGLYMMSKEEGGTIGGYRALFSLKEGGQAKAMEFAIDDMLDYNGEGETTGIVYVSEDGMRTMPANVDIYTIGGMKVGKGVKALNSLKKGIYIVNGEKIVVR
ncbi:MAG: hypothetical protein IJY03_05255 [Prevotella sp.]|nr:hypothetical protein [Prevotella sp.]